MPYLRQVSAPLVMSDVFKNAHDGHWYDGSCFNASQVVPVTYKHTLAGFDARKGMDDGPTTHEPLDGRVDNVVRRVSSVGKQAP